MFQMPINKITVSALLVLAVVFSLLAVFALFNLQVVSLLIDGALAVLFSYQAKAARAALRWPFYGR
jgi:hypothetical protein